MKYNIIIFDADETLFDFEKSEKISFQKTMLSFNINCDENYCFKIYKAINTEIWKELEAGLITQKALNPERFKRFCSKLNLKSDVSKLAETYKNNLSNSSILYEDSIKLIEGLNKNYKLFIITNGLTEIQYNRIKKSIISHYFEDIIISEEAGVSKPDSKIFEIALQNIKSNNKNKVLMVGDSLSSDIQGGINYGIDTCWFNPKKSVNKTKIIPTYEISSLLELNQILNN